MAGIKRPREEEELANDAGQADGEAKEPALPKAVVLFPGSFSPVQLSHINVAILAARVLRERGELDLHSIRFSPVSDAYGKKGLWPAADRLKLTRLAVQEANAREGCEELVVDAWETEQPQFLRTSAVAQHFTECFKSRGEAQCILLLAGADLVEGMFAIEATAKIPKPWTVESVGNLVAQLDGFIVICREGSEALTPAGIRERLKEKLADSPTAEKAANLTIYVTTEDAGNGSSTDVRHAIAKSGLKNEESTECLRQMVGSAVLGEILIHRDYYLKLCSPGIPRMKTSEHLS